MVAPTAAAAARSLERMTRILMISTEMPVPPMTGGRVRTRHLAEALSALGPVTIAGFALEDEPPPELCDPLRAVAVPWKPPPLYAEMESGEESISARAFAALAAETADPWIVSCYESQPLRAAIRELVSEADLVVVEHTLMGAYLAELPSAVPTILDLHNLYSRAARRAAEAGDEHAREARRVARFERKLLETATLTVVVSEVEASAARELAPAASIEVLPNGVDTTFFMPSAGTPMPGYLLFTGLMNYAPNVEGVMWFVREVLPRLPGATLNVVGSTPAEEVLALACGQVVVHGEVPDTRPFQRDASVVVAPLLSGAGTRLKILEAAACGNAIVATSVGAEGLELVAGRDLLIADRAEDFASAVRDVLGDPELRARLGQNARRASESYDWRILGARLRVLARALLDRRAARSELEPAREP
jgi:glycosyltransferase involved in cell wall biosynthesis